MSTVDLFRMHNVSAFFHFTDTRNIPSIRDNGGLYSIAELKKRAITVPAPGGNEWSHDADGYKNVDRYVHLCFRPTHPMEFVARRDGRIISATFLQIHPEILERPGVMFAPDVANKAGVPIYPMAEAKDKIDFEVLYTRTNWSDVAIQNRLQLAEKCEILVPDHVPLKFIRNLPNG